MRLTAGGNTGVEVCCYCFVVAQNRQACLIWEKDKKKKRYLGKLSPGLSEFSCQVGHIFLLLSFAW